MRNIIICLTLIFLSSCKYENKDINRENEINKVAINQSNNNLALKELLLPYCLKIDTLYKNDYYESNLDTFLIHHNIHKSYSLEINKRFHNRTIDFVSEKEEGFMHYPHNKEAWAIYKMFINSKVTVIFYAYLYQSEISQPRIEIQTFDNKQRNIDNLIIASTFTYECGGNRGFCIDKNKKITINDYYGCYDVEDENAPPTIIQKSYKFKISDKGRFVPLK